MSPSERKRRVIEYVRERLRKEAAAAGWGGQAAIARGTKTSSAHIANMLKPRSTSNPGEDFRYKVAEYWKISYAELERLALGEPPAPDAETPLTRKDLLDALEAWERRKAPTTEEETPPPGQGRPKKSSSGDG
jgi:transcriptional regulator with XRE-family HTH domain